MTIWVRKRITNILFRSMAQEEDTKHYLFKMLANQNGFSLPKSSPISPPKAKRNTMINPKVEPPYKIPHINPKKRRGKYGRTNGNMRR